MNDMDYVSQETHEYANIALTMAETLEYNIGSYCGSPRAGDTVWFLLCEKDNPYNVYVLICTPYGYLGEWNVGEDIDFSIVSNIGSLLEHLKNSGYRALVSDEKDEWKEG